MMGLFELIYYAGYRMDTALKLRRRKSLPIKVISIGNMTIGGTGKTPATIALAAEAQRRGMRPCILSRGYGGRARDTRLVGAEARAADVGDEPLLMARRLQGVPVVKDPMRYRGGMYALNNLRPVPDLFILDDGFQHRALERDVDVVLLDARAPFGRGRLLPIGRLREPAEQISRADFVLLTRSSEAGYEEAVRKIRRYNTTAEIFSAEHVPSHVSFPSTGGKVDQAWLAGKEVFAFSGIAGPDSFFDSLRREGAVIRGVKRYRDHYAYRRKDLSRIIGESMKCGASFIITTEKDIMRLEGFVLPDNLVSLVIDFRVQGDYYGRLFDQLSVRENR